jgi:hypothetical protein
MSYLISYGFGGSFNGSEYGRNTQLGNSPAGSTTSPASYPALDNTLSIQRHAKDEYVNKSLSRPDGILTAIASISERMIPQALLGYHLDDARVRVQIY